MFLIKKEDVKKVVPNHSLEEEQKNGWTIVKSVQMPQLIKSVPLEKRTIGEIKSFFRNKINEFKQIIERYESQYKEFLKECGESDEAYENQ